VRQAAQDLSPIIILANAIGAVCPQLADLFVVKNKAAPSA
jgi:hypothetical protein